MTDEELLGYLRRSSVGYTHPLRLAADRIEALRAELEAYRNSHLHADKLLLHEKARAERLAAALVEHNDLLRSALAIAKREGVEGRIASTNWDAYYNRVAVVLKRHHRTANEARAALTTEKTHE